MSAAYTLYASLGFAATTIERLCAEARISNRAFYECFGSREELLQAVHSRCMEESLAVVSQALQEASDEGIDQQIRAGIEAYMAFATSDRRRARILHLEVRRSGHVLTNARQRGVEAFAQLIEDTMKDTAPSPRINPHLLALALIGAIQELLIEWVVNDPPPPVEQLAEVAVHIFHRAYLPAGDPA